MPVRPEFLFAADEESPYYGKRKSVAEVIGRGADAKTQSASLPPGWVQRRWDGWEGWTPWDWAPRLQGWKIHVSTTPECASETLVRVTRICVAESVAFKFLPLLSNLRDVNGKQHDRGTSGKFITIYPSDDDQFARLLSLLDGALSGQSGPYILSDLRYGDGPVYVRYGGIWPLAFPDDADRPISAIAEGESLGLVRDQRQPRFIVPPGVTMPPCLDESFARSRASTRSRLTDFATIVPLHFSNAGGVYRATTADGTQRVLREARSHTGLDARGRDAIGRQREEETVLAELSPVSGVQTLIGSFWAWEHRFLELEYAPGRPLTSWVVKNLPCDGDRHALLSYAARAVALGGQMIAILEQIHDHGWCVGDLHPGNVLVSDTDDVTFIDFEDATRIDGPREVGFRVFEFCAPSHLSGGEADWYAVSRMLMQMYVPDWEIEVVAPGYWEHAMQRVREQYGDAAHAQLAAVVDRFPRVDRHLLTPAEVVDLWGEPCTAGNALDRIDLGLDWSRQILSGRVLPG